VTNYFHEIGTLILPSATECIMVTRDVVEDTVDLRNIEVKINDNGDMRAQDKTYYVCS